MAQQLRDPAWRPAFRECPACGYDLRELPPARPCPECGLDLGDDALILSGVLRGFGQTNKARRLGWVLLCIWVVLWLQGCPLLVVALSASGTGNAIGVIYAAGWLGIITLFVVLWLTRDRRQTGAIDQILINSQGFGLSGRFRPATRRVI